MPAPPPASHNAAELSVYFSPNGGAADAIVAEIDGAEKSIAVQAMRLTNKAIIQALVRADERGVTVLILLDSAVSTGATKYADATYFHNAGIAVRGDSEHAIAHNKVMVIDGRIVVTGSYNFSEAAENRNAENVLIIRSRQDIVDAYATNFAACWGHSEPYLGVPGG